MTQCGEYQNASLRIATVDELRYIDKK